MRRSTSVLGAVLALALTANAAGSAASGVRESQTASAPVRVASEGDGGTSSEAPAYGGQTATGSEGATQVGSVGADVPVSVLSNDGDYPDTTGGDDGAEVVGEVTDVGVGALAEVLDRGIREAAAATGTTTDGTVTTPVARGVARTLETSAAAFRGVASGAAGSSSGGAASVGTITGVAAWLLVAAGVWLLLSGVALLLVLRFLATPGRHAGVRDAAPRATGRFVR